MAFLTPVLSGSDPAGVSFLNCKLAVARVPRLRIVPIWVNQLANGRARILTTFFWPQVQCLFFFFLIYLFMSVLVFVSVRGLSLVAASGGHSSSRCTGLSLSRPLLLRSTASRRAGSVIVAHGPSCSVACGIFPDQGSNPCALHWQADSQPLRHQGSPQVQCLLCWPWVLLFC